MLHRLFALALVLLLGLGVSQASAQMLLLGAGKGAPTASNPFSFIAAPAGQNTVSASVTFTNINFGGIPGLIVIVASSQGTVFTGMAIDGNTATKSVEESSVISGLQIWYYNDVVGLGNVSIVGTAGGAMGQEAIVVARITGMNATPTSTNGHTNAIDPAVIAVTVPALGFSVVGYYGTGGGAGWTNSTLAGATSTADGLVLSMAYTQTTGSPTYTTGGTNVAHQVSTSWGP